MNAFDIDNLVLNDNVEDHFSIEEELEDDGDEDDGGGGDIGDYFIKGLMDIWTIYIFLSVFILKTCVLYCMNLCLIGCGLWTLLVYWIIAKVCYFDLF